MRLPFAMPKQRARSKQDSPPEARLRGRRLLAARAAWLAVVLLAVVVCVATLPVEFARLQKVCFSGACIHPHLTPESLAELQAMGFTVNAFATFFIFATIVFVAVWFAAGVLIFWHRSDNRLALFASLFLVTFGLSFAADPRILSDVYPAWRLPGAVVAFIGANTLFLFFCVFPDGHFVPRWLKWLAIASIAQQAPIYFFPDLPLNSDHWPAPLALMVYLALFGALVAAQVYRYRRVSSQLQRQQTKWLIFSFALAIAILLTLGFLDRVFTYSGLVAELVSNTAIFISFALIPISICVAILRCRLWDIDILINRTLIFGTLTACVVGIYVLVIGSLSLLFQTSGNLPISLVATGLVAVLFQPLRGRLQRGINRLLYGERDEPYAVLASLGQRLESALDPEAILPTIVETVRDALKLPYAAIIVDQERSASFVAASGSPVANPLSLPLLYQGEALGQLVLGPRGAGEMFNTADRNLIAVLARQAGVAAHAVRLTAALQRSREQLVLAREEERRRLRNDLHDGIGPQLAGLTMKIQTARLRLAHDPLADTLLSELVARTQDTVADIRRVVYDLRPPSLDELGLLSALRESAAQYQADGNAGVQIHVDAPKQLEPLPAAVEVAIFRIAQEAMTNVVRHAKAQTCWLRLSIDAPARVLCLDVQDDGEGIAPERHLGVGLRSMRERAAELGGTLTVEPAAVGGTLVRARLPLPA
jgi:signal transduction histidine kinase